MKITAHLLLALLLALVAGVIIPRVLSPRISVPHKAPDTTLRAYQVGCTVTMEGKGSFQTQVAGVMTVRQFPCAAGDVAFAYALSTRITAGNAHIAGELTTPPALLLRDANNRRLTGGEPYFRNFGVVANQQLARAFSAPPDAGIAVFGLPGEGLPQRVSTRITATRGHIDWLGDVMLVFSETERFEWQTPGNGPRVQASARCLYIFDERRQEVYYRCASFVADGPDGRLRIQDIACVLRDGRAASWTGLGGEFDAFYARLDLADPDRATRTTAGLPLWALHSLAVRDGVDVACGAHIEGRPNFVVVATVGLALLIDSGVSAGTRLLHEAGVIDWDWQGLPNYVGGSVGLGAARLAGARDETLWRDVGGIAGDVASLFVPSSLLGAGLQTIVGGGTFGLKTLQNVDLAGKAWRISQHGSTIVKAGVGLLDSAELATRLDAASKTLALGQAALDLSTALRTHRHTDDGVRTRNALPRASYGQLLASYHTAILFNDTVGLRECFDRSAASTVAYWLSAMRASHLQLRRAVIAAHGEKAWAALPPLELQKNLPQSLVGNGWPSREEYSPGQVGWTSMDGFGIRTWCRVVKAADGKFVFVAVENANVRAPTDAEFKAAAAAFARCIAATERLAKRVESERLAPDTVDRLWRVILADWEKELRAIRAALTAYGRDAAIDPKALDKLSIKMNESAVRAALGIPHQVVRGTFGLGYPGRALRYRVNDGRTWEIVISDRDGSFVEAGCKGTTMFSETK